MAAVFLIFASSVALNVAFRLMTPNAGAYRRGFDTVVFCSVATGYIGGSASGIIYGPLIAISYYVLRSKQWDYAIFVVPLAAATGGIAGAISTMEFTTAGMLLFVFYHSLSAIFVAVYRSIRLQYLAFVGINFVTTLLLLRITDLFIR